ncbi:hypothetical protein Amet_0693 [Alkaliphilus metalliredigens QYMF]|uniref:Polysaccharide biosynthesis protein n=1 Tax=Alkaliphilus metalliredigens (strain QYMF) TaxID=293826 RepID=A6TL50_ALKMQ|nr:hypothetical protein [Alkaliphilus metalliredigens]ABR46918.1 hypothetical protein Amet_0693 [Alkaliphilus metalliredigens QYMF]
MFIDNVISRQKEKVRSREQQAEIEISMMEQLRFFLPLGLMQMFISFTHSLFNAACAKLPNPEIYLSAFAIGKNVLLLIQNPVSMIKQTVTALVDDEASYLKIRKFFLMATTVIVLFFALFTLLGGAQWMLANVMGIKGQVLKEAVTILKVFIIFPVVVGLRNFVQGTSIKFRMTPVITLAAFIRVIYVALLLLFIDKLLWIPGGILIAGLFLSSIIVETLVVCIIMKIMVKNPAKEFEQMKLNQMLDGEERGVISTRLIMSFFIPLSVTALIRTLALPIIDGGLARTVAPEVAISSFAVAWGLGIIISGTLMMFHQVPLNFIKSEGHRGQIRSVKRFAVYVAMVLSIVIGIIAFTPLGVYITHELIGATEEITFLAVDALKIMTLLPLVMTARQYYWGILMRQKRTKIIGKGKIVNVISLTTAVIIGALINPVNPAIIGMIGMVAAEFLESLYLCYQTEGK